MLPTEMVVTCRLSRFPFQMKLAGGNRTDGERRFSTTDSALCGQLSVYLHNKSLT